MAREYSYSYRHGWNNERYVLWSLPKKRIWEKEERRFHNHNLNVFQSLSFRVRVRGVLICSLSYAPIWTRSCISLAACVLNHSRQLIQIQHSISSPLPLLYWHELTKRPFFRAIQLSFRNKQRTSSQSLMRSFTLEEQTMLSNTLQYNTGWCMRPRCISSNGRPWRNSHWDV